MADRGPSARDKLRSYFQTHVGRVVDSETLRHIGGISEWARRVRELRDQEGMDIQTHKDRADLKPGQYVLASTKLRVVFDRRISKETRALVLDRNGFTCQMCGIGAGEVHPYDGRKVQMHIGHVDESGSSTPENLRTLCSVCNEGLSNISADRPSAIKLLSQLRRAGIPEQLEVLDWLVNKFPGRASAALEHRPPSDAQ